MAPKSGVLSNTALCLFAWTALQATGVLAASLPQAVQAGYHVIHSYDGLTPPKSLLDLTRQGQVGGIILFGENVDQSNISATAKTVASFQSAYKASPYYDGTPLLIVTDQEGGQIVRLPGGPSLSAKQVGKSSAPKGTAQQTGIEAAKACRAAGVNGNLAPINGVYRKEGDFLDQYQRSYGNNASIVSQCAPTFAEAQQKNGVLSTAKHFPGLGGAGRGQNTDAEPVTINISLNDLRAIDEVPFSNSIAGGVAMVMPSWAIYPALDTKPAGLSRKWIQGELRQRLNFKGVTISDAIEAGALSKGGYGANDGERGVLATVAGMDIILAAARNATQGGAVVNALVKGLNDGTINSSDFDAATQRIKALRKTLSF